MPNPIIDVAFRQKQELANRQEASTTQLTNAYQVVVNNLQRNIEDLNNQILVETQNGQELTQSKLFRLSRYISLQNQIIEELRNYGAFTDLTIRSSVPEFITMGTEHSYILVRDQFTNQNNQRALTVAWNKLNPEQIETALSFLKQDSPFNTVLTNSLGESVASYIEDAVIQSVIVGKNPRATARLINERLNLGLVYSLNTARTAQIYSYRTATSLNYRNNSDIVGGWKWLSALDRRTCTSCLANHGQLFPLDQILNDHHQGRCTQIPELRDWQKYGLEPLDIVTGADWFDSLNHTQQLEVMGSNKLRAYRNGEFLFSEQSRPYENQIYGTMLREATLRELVGTG